ncbi:MAG: dockerin type I repeat-containing protein [Patescibacteria group bacterium]
MFSSIFFRVADAQEFDSDGGSFKLLNPVIFPGGYGAAADGTQLWGVITQHATGLSNSSDATLNEIRAGFLYFSVEAAVTPSQTTSGPGSFAPTIAPLFPAIFPVPITLPPCPTVTKISDLNCDGQTNLKDFSVFLSIKDNPENLKLADLNKDTKVDTKDFSVIFYDWTAKIIAFNDNGASGETSQLIPQARQRNGLALIGSQVQEPVSQLITPSTEKPAEGQPKSGILQKAVNFISNIVKGVWAFVRRVF